MPRARDLTGQKFGRLTAVSQQGWVVRSNTRFRVWLCSCECGNQITALTGALTSGNTRSCGCWKRDGAKARRTTHGRSTTALHRVWLSMIARCTNPNKKSYADYGGRGIAVCARWRGSFESFLADMGERPEGATIERKDNDKGYEPGNCIWLPRSKQNQNQRRRKDNTSGTTGVIFKPNTGKWEAFIGAGGKRVYLGVFNSVPEAAAARAEAMERLGFNRNHGAHA